MNYSFDKTNTTVNVLYLGPLFHALCISKTISFLIRIRVIGDDTEHSVAVEALGPTHKKFTIGPHRQFVSLTNVIRSIILVHYE